MFNVECAVIGCKTTQAYKKVGIYLHPCPVNSDMRNKWLHALKNKCTLLDWNKSKICSKHFQQKFFDHMRNLKAEAIPTIFPSVIMDSNKNNNVQLSKALGKLSQKELETNIKNSLQGLQEPTNLEKYLQKPQEAPLETKLWLIIKKQEHLNSLLQEKCTGNEHVISELRKNIDNIIASQRSVQKNMDSQKFMVKNLQEKLATLEEQIEILSSVETR